MRMILFRTPLTSVLEAVVNESIKGVNINEFFNSKPKEEKIKD
jgi:hypothetical protein